MSASAARSPDNLLRPDGNDLCSNYGTHDIADAYVSERLSWYGFDVEQYGIDQRENDEQLVFDDRPDLRVTHDGELVGYVEVKAKSRAHDDWYMILNERHWEKYLRGGDREDSQFDGALNIDVPVWIFMSVVDDDLGVIDCECVIPVKPTVEVARTFQAPDGNTVVVIDDEYGHYWERLVADLRQ